MASNYEQLVEALRCKGLSKKCDSCDYGFHISPDSECNDACHVEQIYADAAAAIEALQAQLPKQGEWLNVTDSYSWYGKCSVCGEEFVVDAYYAGGMNYCPNCGAKMEVQDADT